MDYPRRMGGSGNQELFPLHIGVENMPQILSVEEWEPLIGNNRVDKVIIRLYRYEKVRVLLEERSRIYENVAQIYTTMQADLVALLKERDEFLLTFFPDGCISIPIEGWYHPHCPR